MKTYQIAVWDDEYDYANSLTTYINSMKDYPCLAVAFCDFQDLVEAYQQGNVFDLLLLGEGKKEVIKQSGQLDNIPQMWLHDNIRKEEIGHFYKYQSAEKLLQSILNQIGYVEKKEDVREIGIDHNQSMLVYGVYSPVGRSGKTNFSKGICAYSRGHSLYIGMEEYGACLDHEGTGQEFLYYLKVHSDEIHTLIDRILADKTGIIMIPSPQSYLDFQQITKDDILWFLAELSKKNYFQTVVFDIGTGSLFDFQIFSLCYKVWVPILEERTAREKEEYFSIFMKQTFQMLYSKLHFVSVPNVPYDSLKMEQFVLEVLRGDTNG